MARAHLYARRLLHGADQRRQELDGELITEVPGSLFPRELIERCRVPPFSPPGLRRE
jgi:phage terminase large subunit-like protein